MRWCELANQARIAPDGKHLHGEVKDNAQCLRSVFKQKLIGLRGFVPRIRVGDHVINPYEA